MCVYPTFRTRSPRYLWWSDLETSDTNGSVWNARRRLASCPLPHKLAAPESCDAIANVRCYDYPAKEVLVKVLGSLLTRLGIRLVRAAVEFVANWSLDTVNTNPLVQTTGACE